MPLSFGPSQPAVVFHLRRGDHDMAKAEGRGTGDSYFYSLATIIREYLPAADIHAFSHTDTYKYGPLSWKRPGTQKIIWGPSDFDGYRQRNITVHLNDESLVQVWSHMARAMIFATDMSSFSFVASLFNSHCVICAHLHCSGIKLLHWLEGR